MNMLSYVIYYIYIYHIIYIYFSLLVTYIFI